MRISCCFLCSAFRFPWLWSPIDLCLLFVLRFSFVLGTEFRLFLLFFCTFVFFAHVYGSFVLLHPNLVMNLPPWRRPNPIVFIFQRSTCNRLCPQGLFRKRIFAIKQVFQEKGHQIFPWTIDNASFQRINHGFQANFIGCFFLDPDMG